MANTQENVVEVLQHRIVWHLAGDTPAPTELPEVQIEHLERMIREGFNQGELLEFDADGKMTHRGWWQIRNDG